MRFKRAIKAKQQRKKVILKGKAANDHQPVNEQKASQRRFRRLSRNKQNKEKRVNQQEQLIKSSSKRKQPNNERQKKSETKKTNVQKIRQKQDRRKQILLKKQKNARISTIKNNKKNQAAKYEYKKQETKTQKSNAKILEKTQTKNKNVPKKIKRKNGKKTTFKKKNLKDKIGKNIKNNISPKHKFKEMLIDKFGRDANGELNIIGFLLSIILLVPFLSTLIIVIAVLAVVIAIIAVILAIWAFIIALFTIKTEDMAITEAYDYVTWLDAYKNKEVYNRYKQLVEDDKYKKVYFEVNGVEADPEKFSFSSNSDNYVYYLNAKYEDYDINKSVLPTYYDRLKKSTGSVPSAAGLLKHDPDGHIRRMLTKNPEFKKYVKPRIKPQSRFKRMTNFRRRKKMDPTQQVNKKPIQYTKADIETRNTFLEELKILDKKGAIEESINRNPKLTQGPMKKVKGRTKGKPAVDRSTISKNESHQRPLNQIMAEGKKKSVQQNAQLLKNKQLNLGRTR